MTTLKCACGEEIITHTQPCLCGGVGADGKYHMTQKDRHIVCSGCDNPRPSIELVQVLKAIDDLKKRNSENACIQRIADNIDTVQFAKIIANKQLDELKRKLNLG